MNRAILIKILLGAAALTAVLLIVTWIAGGFQGMSGDGVAALILGVTLSMFLGIGLMALIFASSRGGYDQDTHDAAKSQFKRPPEREE